MRVNVYVDGFNLYFGALRGQPYRWLDLHAFSSRLLRPSDAINRIRYFTARIRGRPGDPTAPERQAAYLRALGSIPNLTTHYGQFLSHPTRLPRVDGSGLADVIRTEEKGSDVNLATHLLLDAFDGDCELALVVSNDSDLAEPIEQVQARFGVRVGVVLPILNRNANGSRRRPSVRLIAAATFDRRINDSARRRRLFAESQFPATVQTPQGVVTKPDSW